ncbi:MAG: extracellular solute-binding protein [Deltaproteobacteria bacterium]|nr:extracellular solute-binding protein [Deltaproteobacteria bacterium]
MKSFLVCCLLVILALSRGANAGAAPIDELIKGAKQEGTIEFYAPSTLTPQGAQALSAAFNKKYAVNVKMQYSPSGNMTRDIGKVVGLGASGVPPEWDLMVVTDAHHATLWVKKMHQAFDYKSVGVDPKAIQYDGGSVSFANQFVLPAYNKKLVSAKDIPKSWEDLLNPKWKGKIGVSSATHHMARLAVGPWGEERTTHFVKELTKQDLILGRLGEIYNRLLLGEIVVAVSLSDSEAKSDKNKTAPVVFAEAVSPLIAPAYHAGVPKNAAHPKAGHLFAAFLATAEAQKIWDKYAGQTSVLIPGTPAHKYVQGKKVVYINQEHAETVDRLSREYGKIFGFTGL